MGINLKSKIWQATRDIKHKKTRDALRQRCRGYIAWARENQIHDFSKEHVQQYYNHEKKHGKLAETTLHNYTKALCHVGGYSFSEIEHEKRIQKLTRSRSDDKNMQGYAEERSGRFKRLVEAQRCIGIRRDELARLKGRNLRTDESGHLCVEVERGKGGKYHLQRLLPEDEKTVKELFRGIGENENVFSAAEINNKIDLHAKRAEHARRTYDYFAKRIENEQGYASELRKEVVRRWHEAHPKENLPRDLYYQLTRSTPYKLRGRIKEQAIEHDRPTEFNRLAVIATSVFSLSHWRSNVAIKHYLT